MKHEHNIVNKYWFNNAYMWCDDRSCGYIVKMTGDNIELAQKDPQKLMDQVVGEYARS